MLNEHHIHGLSMSMMQWSMSTRPGMSFARLLGANPAAGTASDFHTSRFSGETAQQVNAVWKFALTHDDLRNCSILVSMSNMNWDWSVNGLARSG